MLTAVKVYSSWRSAPTLPLSAGGRPENDLIQIRNIEGLGPAKASVNTTPFGSVDGSDYIGGTVPSRNIVLTLHPNPDWKEWTFESLRRLLYSYFMPKRPIRLVFNGDDIVPVEISGIVESVEPNIFSKDPEFLVSIVCPDPYFTALTPVVVTGESIRPGGTAEVIEYNGNIEAGIYVKISGDSVTGIAIQIGDVGVSTFEVAATVNSSMYLEISSVPMQKYVQNVSVSDGVITSQLAALYAGYTWPTLQPGENDFSVITGSGTQDWELTYYERFGGL